MPVVKLTEQYIRNNLQCPETKSRIEYCDSELPGLYVEVRATSQGQGTYYVFWYSCALCPRKSVQKPKRRQIDI